MYAFRPRGRTQGLVSRAYATRPAHRYITKPRARRGCPWPCRLGRRRASGAWRRDHVALRLRSLAAVASGEKGEDVDQIGVAGAGVTVDECHVAGTVVGLGTEYQTARTRHARHHARREFGGGEMDHHGLAGDEIEAVVIEGKRLQPTHLELDALTHLLGCRLLVHVGREVLVHVEAGHAGVGMQVRQETQAPVPRARSEVEHALALREAKASRHQLQEVLVPPQVTPGAGKVSAFGVVVARSLGDHARSVDVCENRLIALEVGTLIAPSRVHLQTTTNTHTESLAQLQEMHGSKGALVYSDRVTANAEDVTLAQLFPGLEGRMQLVRVMLVLRMPELRDYPRDRVLEPALAAKLKETREAVLNG